MFVDDVKTSAEHRLAQIAHTLKHVYDTELTLDESTIDELAALHDSSEIVKNSIVSESAFNSWHSNPTYTKHMLIMEAVRLYLTEIAPRRRPKNLRESNESSLNESHATKVGRWMMNFAEKANTNDDKLLAMLNSFGRVGEDLVRVGQPFAPKTLKDLIAYYEARVGDTNDDEDDRRQAKENLMALRMGHKMYDKHHAKKTEESAPVEEETVAHMADAGAASHDMDPELAALMKKYGVAGGETLDEMPSPRAMARAARSWADSKMNRDRKLHRIDRTPGDGNSKEELRATASDAIQDFLQRGGKIKKVASEEITDEGNEFTGALAAAKAAHKDEFEVDGKTYKVNEQMTSRIARALNEEHMQHHDYQASMARSELYRNAKYGMDMLKMIRKEDEIEPWIAASLTMAAANLDKIYHYMDYYMHAEPGVLGEDAPMADYSMDDEDIGGDDELGETSGSIARMNLLSIVEDSIKLFQMIQPGDHLEGWIAMKLTKASGGISSAKHFLDYKAFERHAGEDVGLEESRYGLVARLLREAAETPEQDLQQAQTLIAAKSISDDLQSMAEKVARMGVDDLMPLVDTMKTQFGPEAADAYNDVMKSQLESLLSATQEAKDQSDDAVLALQGGGIPGQGASDIENVGMEPGAAAPEVPDMGDGTGTMPAAAGGEEPLGRAKKEVPGEEEIPGLAESRKKVAEKWGTEMHTAEKDKGKWDGYTVAELKAKKKKLMDKEERSAAEQKTVKQIDFAIRAKQKDKWGDIKKESVDEAKAKGKKPDFLDIDKDGDKKEPMTKAIKDKAKDKKVDEAAKKSKSPYAIGMWQAKKSAGMDPDKPAKDLPKKVIKKAHEIGKEIEKTDEAIARAGKLVETALRGKRKYEADLAEHRAEFAKRLAEGKVKDLLKSGQGIEGDLLEKKIASCVAMAADLNQQIRILESDSKAKLFAAIKDERKAVRFAEARATKPYGVMYEGQNGKRMTKFFEDQKARDYWAQLNSDVKPALINPEHFDRAAAK